MQNPNAQRTTGFQVREPAELLCFIMNALSGISRNKAKAILAGGGVTVNGEKETDIRRAYTKDELTAGLLVKRGKKTFRKFVLA